MLKSFPRQLTRSVDAHPEGGAGRDLLALGLLASVLYCLCALLPISPAEASGPPQIASTWVTEVTSTSAVLHAEINPEGSNTSYRFEYLSLAELQANENAGRAAFAGARSVPPSNSALGSGSKFQPVSFTLSPPTYSLLPDTEYRFRVLASNPALAEGPVRGLRTRSFSSSTGLPDARAWELVSPIDKGGGQIAAPAGLFGGGQIQAAADGASITYDSATAFATPLGAPPGSQYLSQRTATGWSTQNLTFPQSSGIYGDEPDGVPYRLFDPDLRSGLLFGGYPCANQPGCGEPSPPLPDSEAPPGYPTYYLRSASGAFLSLLSAADLSYTTVSPARFGLALVGATPDLSHVLLSSCAALTADAFEELETSEACNPADTNLYEWDEGHLTLINSPPPSEILPPPFARLAAPIGAVSEDGNRVYWEELTSHTLWLSEAGAPARGLPESSQGAFQGASATGGVAYYTVGEKLYRYLASSQESTPIATEVSGVLAVSSDGAYVYYQDAAGLELWHDGGVVRVAPGADATIASDYPPALATARLSEDGTVLAFLSAAPLGYDNTDAQTGLPDTELYLYDAEGSTLICVSCSPTGERPQGSASIPGALQNGITDIYRPRALSVDGRRLFFQSSAGLVGSDTNSRPDVYQWESGGEGSCARPAGCLDLISSGRGASATFLDASATGSDVFFLTENSLVSGDPGSADVYDARVGGGLAEPEEPIACEGDACQPLPSPPEDPTPGTSLPNPGNPAPYYYKPHKKKHHQPKHRHRHRHHRGHR